MRNFITIFIYIILLPTFEYFRHSLQYIDILTIQIRHTTNEGRKPIPNISALIARITASTLHILFVILNALNAHFPTIIFSASSQVSSGALIISYFLIAASYSGGTAMFESVNNMIGLTVSIAAFLGIMAEVVIIQQKSVDCVKIMNPEKTASVYDMKFQKKI